MPVIQSGHDVHIVVKRLLGEQHGNGWACPWCREKGAYAVDDEATSDRLFLSTRMEEGRHPIRFVCRQAVDGLVDHTPIHSLDELFSDFSKETLELGPGVTWGIVAREFLAIVGTTIGQVDPSKAFWSKVQILQLHQHPSVYTEWGKLGFSKKTIDKLRLGVTDNGRLVIPIDHLVPDPTFGMYPDGNVVQRTRIPHGVEPTKYNPKYYWPRGLPPSMWYIPGEDKVCRIFEGDTSAIAGVEIWPNSTVAMAPGAGNWSVKMSEYLLARGHTEFHIYTDNDVKGTSYELSILQAFQDAVTKRGTDWEQLVFKTVLWPQGTPDKYDPRKALEEFGAEAARDILERWIVHDGWYSKLLPTEGRHHAMFDEEYAKTSYAQEYQQLREKVYSLETLRGTTDSPGLIYQEIDNFVENYEVDEEGSGRVLLIRSTPGVGKTRAAVQYAENYAREYLQKREKRVQRVLEKLYEKEQTEEVKAKIAKYEQGRYKKLAVVFIGPYIDGFEDVLQHSSDPSLWYNFRARDDETCQRMNLANKAINAGYGIMKTCCIEGGLCPLRDACLGVVNGVQQYLSQLEEVERHPIVYLRHNHLYMKNLLNKARLIIVDEDPASVSLSAVTLTASSLEAFDAYNMLEGEDADVVNRFVEAVAACVKMYTPDNRWLASRELVRAIHVTRGDKLLHELAEHIARHGLLDEIATWRPYNLDKAPDGRIVGLLELLVRDVLRIEPDWNGQVFVQAQTITYYPMQPFQIEQRKPVVALDATGMAYKYQLSFNRPVLEFHAEVYPYHARVYTVTNTENTMSTLHENLKQKDAPVSRYGIRDKMTIVEKQKPQDFASLYDSQKVPNVALREVIRMTLGLTHRHGSLLLVTYKSARMFIEEFVKKHFPDYYPYIGFAHFRALRGLNIYENLPAALIAGTFRVPPDILRRDLTAFHKDDPEILNLSTTRLDEYYHATPWRYSTLTVADSRKTVQDYVYEMEAGEIQQVAGRIRAAVSDTEKYIYLMTARPAMPWTTYRGVGSPEWDSTQVYDSAKDPYFRSLRTASWYWFEAVESMKHIQRFIDQYGRMPTAKQLTEDTGYTDYQTRRMLDYWENFYEG